MIYVPDKTNYKCFVVQDTNTIRAYKQVPARNTTVEYRDYYVNSNYMYRDGTQTYSNTATLPVCMANSETTTEVYYRNDFDSILVIFIIFTIVCIILPLKIVSKLFKRGRL